MPACKFPLCTRNAEKNGYCVGHRIYAPGAGSKPKATDPKPTNRPEQVKKKPRKAVRKKSVKLAAQHREYVKIVREMLAESPWCELKTPDCTKVAQGLHHGKGRGVNLLNRKHLKRACNGCNGYVDRHPAWAIENGHSVSRHIK